MKGHQLLARLKRVAGQLSKYWGEASFSNWPYDDPWVYGSWLGDELYYLCKSPIKHTEEEDTN